jgi:hypothetical protein
MLAVPNNTRDHAVAFTRLIIVTIAGADIQRVIPSHPTVRLEVSRDALEQLAAGYSRVAAQEGDFCIGEEEHAIWFWWWPTRG